MKIIHITGTNGKGSVAFKIAKGLEKAGKKVGLYTSPHLYSPRERVQINSMPIPAHYLIDLPLGPPDFFARMTEIAFAYFEQEGVDYAVIEVGIGGKRDVTNRVTPTLCVITSVGLDHQEYLGDTREEIAEEKAGIIKNRVPVIIGPTADYPCIRARTDRVIKIQTCATYQEENTRMAAAALAELGIKSNQAIFAELPGRFERIGHALFDGAHNLQAMERLLSQIEGEIHVIYGSTKRRHVEECLPLLAERAQRIRTVQAAHERMISFASPYPEMESFSEEWTLAKGRATLLVTGSFYLLDPLRIVAASIHLKERPCHFAAGCC